tara:strand:+ start:142 stop:777 length:636 start_codon:yes stop_codon:yes gene_type:complete
MQHLTDNKTTYLIGITGVSILSISFIIGGFLIENYDIVNQYISESYAIDTKYGIYLRIFGYIPSGILISIFCFLGVNYFQPDTMVKIGFYGIGIFYGFGTVVTGIFPCDSGCNKELIDPSFSQIAHNFSALLIYLLTPLFIILIGLGLKKSIYLNFSIQSLLIAVISSFFVFTLGSNLSSEYIGIYQRTIEFLFVLWVVLCAFEIKKTATL